jgi:hypothetical protein
VTLSIKKSETEEVIWRAKKDLVAALEGKRADYFGGLKRLSKTYIEREVQECLEKTVNEVNARFFPFPQEVLIFTHFTPDDNCFSVTLEPETWKGELRKLAVPCQETGEFPHTINLYFREPLNATGEYRVFLCDISRELILTARSWIKERLFELLKALPLANKLYGVFSEEEKKILGDLWFAPVYPDEDKGEATHYLINPLAVEKVYDKLKETAPELWTTPIALLADLARTPIPYNETFARLAEGKEKPEKVRIDKSAKYQNKRKRYFQSEKAVMGDFAYAYEIYDAGDGNHLFAEYPGNRKDITDIIVPKKRALRQAYHEFLDYEKNKKKAKYERLHETTKNEKVVFLKREHGKRISPEVSEEIRFIVDKIRNFSIVGQKTPSIVNEFDCLAKSKQNDKVARRVSLFSSVFSFFLEMPNEGLDSGQQYLEEREDKFIETIKQIMAERGLPLNDHESEKLTAEIRDAIKDCNILTTLGESGAPLPVAPELPKVAPELYKDRPKGEDARQFLYRVYGKWMKAGILCQRDLHGGDNPLDKGLYEGLKTYCRNRGLKLASVLPPLKSTSLHKAENLTPDQLIENPKEAARLAMVLVRANTSK